MSRIPGDIHMYLPSFLLLLRFFKLFLLFNFFFSKSPSSFFFIIGLFFFSNFSLFLLYPLHFPIFISSWVISLSFTTRKKMKPEKKKKTRNEIKIFGKKKEMLDKHPRRSFGTQSRQRPWWLTNGNKPTGWDDTKFHVL